MKRIAIVALMLPLGIARLYAQDAQERSAHVTMKFSGSNVATAINLVPDAVTVTDETHLTGNGSLGAFTFRELHADGASPQPPVGCSGPNFAVVAGAGVFTFEDGSLLVVTVADGSVVSISPKATLRSL
jgi:hypothetical protein